MTERDAIDELALLLDGGAPEDAPSSLAALATLATAVRDHADVTTPRPEFRDRLRAELLAVADAPPGLVERTRAAWQARTAGLRASTRVAVATMTASSMIGSAGVAVASQEALPGDLLYGLKGVTEDVRLALAADAVAEARLHLAFAAERLEELRATAGRLDTDQVVALLAEMDAHSEAGAEAMMAAVDAGAADPSELKAFTDRQRDGLVAVLDDLPVLARPVAEDSLELLRRIDITAAGARAVPADCDCEDALVPGTDGPRSTGTAVMPTLPVPATTNVVAPGDGPAVPDLSCDCIELPGGDDVREPEPVEDEARDDGSTTDEQPRQNPFEGTGELTSPSSDNDEGDDDGVVEAPTSTEQLPTQQAVDAVEGATGADVSTGPAERLQDGVADLLD